MLESPPNLTEAVHKLHRLTLYCRWLIVAFCWLIVIPLSLWRLREEIALMREYFTWSALRYSLIYRLVPSFCIFASIGITLAVLLWHSRFILWGILPKERRQLEKQVRQIYATGPRHPFWKWLFNPSC